MDRIIKFRIWDKTGHFYGAKGNPFVFNIFNVPHFLIPDNFIAQQFTGLLDINNKEIFEGDIVKITYTDATPEGRLDFETVKRLVKWDSVELKWGLAHSHFCENLSDFKNNIEVVGNIFESPN